MVPSSSELSKPRRKRHKSVQEQHNRTTMLPAPCPKIIPDEVIIRTHLLANNFRKREDKQRGVGSPQNKPYLHVSTLRGIAKQTLFRRCHFLSVSQNKPDLVFAICWRIAKPPPSWLSCVCKEIARRSLSWILISWGSRNKPYLDVVIIGECKTNSILTFLFLGWSQRKPILTFPFSKRWQNKPYLDFASLGLVASSDPISIFPC